MRKLKWLPGLILTGLMGYGCGPSISGAPIGLPDIRIPVSALPFLCRDVDSPLGVTPTTNVEKWLEVRSAFGLPDSLLRLHTAPARTGPRREGPVKLLVDSVAMSGANNERHDCQGLIGTVNGADKYTAFVTLWVSSALARTSFPERTVVAGITLAGDDYSPLRLRQTRNCVILQGSDPNDDGAEWRAWILNIHHDQTCDASHAGGISYLLKKLFHKAHRLNVYRHEAADVQPIAGRWIDTGSQYYIGLQCGPKHFCVIGVDEAGRIPAVNIALLSAASDHQRLAKKSGGALVPSRLRGTIRAVKEEVKASTDPDPTDPVGDVTLKLEGNDPWALAQYSTKWGITVEIGASIPMSLKETSTGSSVWDAKYGTGTSRRAYFEKAYHSGPHTVRWRWDPNDEGTWKQCGEGCCGGH